ncbi:MAG: aspartate-semialdehyde dehydrogenase [Chlamydiota bacterium]|nr:aspartate-semialdehyde dehydrogenase [Chlamydiota bacterium]
MNKENNKKIPVGILGATGMVGQKFIKLLENHPWFEIVALGASSRSAGKMYGEVVNWQVDGAIPQIIAKMKVQSCEPKYPCQIVFSGLDSSVAGEIENAFANAGHLVISNSKNHRMGTSIPLLIPEVNADHIELIKTQSFSNGGAIVTNPNCSVVGLATALKPLDDIFSVKAVDVVTLQALSGAGYPGVPSMDILNNVIPYIHDEEDKVETEPQKILGCFNDGKVDYHPMKVSAQCTRVPVIDGHLECVTLTLGQKTSKDKILDAWKEFSGEPQKLKLPSAPNNPIVYFEDPRYPQPRRHSNLERGMAVSTGRLREVGDGRWKFIVLSHNTIRGAAGGAILNAEILIKKGYLRDE